MIIADCNLDQVQLGRSTVFDFDKHRQPWAYARITDQVGAVEPHVWSRGKPYSPGLTRDADKQKA